MGFCENEFLLPIYFVDCLIFFCKLTPNKVVILIFRIKFNSLLENIKFIFFIENSSCIHTAFSFNDVFIISQFLHKRDKIFMSFFAFQVYLHVKLLSVIVFAIKLANPNNVRIFIFNVFFNQSRSIAPFHQIFINIWKLIIAC